MKSFRVESFVMHLRKPPFVLIYSKENFWPVLLRVNAHWTNWYQMIIWILNQYLRNQDFPKVLNQVFILILIILHWSMLKIPCNSKLSPSKIRRVFLKEQFFIEHLQIHDCLRIFLRVESYFVMQLAISKKITNNARFCYCLSCFVTFGNSVG